RSMVAELFLPGMSNFRGLQGALTRFLLKAPRATLIGSRIPAEGAMGPPNDLHASDQSREASGGERLIAAAADWLSQDAREKERRRDAQVLAWRRFLRDLARPEMINGHLRGRGRGGRRRLDRSRILRQGTDKVRAGTNEAGAGSAERGAARR